MKHLSYKYTLLIFSNRKFTHRINFIKLNNDADNPILVDVAGAGAVMKKLWEEVTWWVVNTLLKNKF